MKADDVFGGNYLKAQHVQQPTTVTIKGVTLKEFTDGERKPIVSFERTDKQLVLNKTNFNRIAHLTGQPDSDDWSGHQITLVVEKVEYQGQLVDGLRVQMPQSLGSPVNPPAPSAQATPDLTDEDIPF